MSSRALERRPRRHEPGGASSRTGPEYAAAFAREVHRYGERHRVRAGITGWAQVHGLRGKTSLADRAEWDNYYIDNWSQWLDFKILLLTLRSLVRFRAE